MKKLAFSILLALAFNCPAGLVYVQQEASPLKKNVLTPYASTSMIAFSVTPENGVPFEDIQVAIEGDNVQNVVMDVSVLDASGNILSSTLGYERDQYGFLKLTFDKERMPRGVKTKLFLSVTAGYGDWNYGSSVGVRIVNMNFGSSDWWFGAVPYQPPLSVENYSQVGTLYLRPAASVSNEFLAMPGTKQSKPVTLGGFSFETYNEDLAIVFPELLVWTTGGSAADLRQLTLVDELGNVIGRTAKITVEGKYAHVQFHVFNDNSVIIPKGGVRIFVRGVPGNTFKRGGTIQFALARKEVGVTVGQTSGANVLPSGSELILSGTKTVKGPKVPPPVELPSTTPILGGGQKG